MLTPCDIDATACRNLHIFAFGTTSTCGWLSCWSQWAATMAAADHLSARDNLTYTLHVRTVADSGSSREYMRGVKSKVLWVEQLLRKPVMGHRDDIYLFTDLDVVPFAPLWPLVREHLKDHEMVFMEEKHSHKGGLGGWMVNSGFYACRLTRNVRLFFQYWAVMLKGNRRLKDQDAANYLLNKQEAQVVQRQQQETAGGSSRGAAQQLRWATFPSHLVTGNLSRISSETVAYHAVGIPSAACGLGCSKTARLREAFRRRNAHGGESLAGSAEFCDPEQRCQGKNANRT